VLSTQKVVQLLFFDHLYTTQDLSSSHPTMASKLNLLASSVFRGLQMLFAVVVVGLSVTLVKNHNNHNDHEGYPGPPIILPLATALGALSLVAAVLSLAIAWTNFLREYIEMLVDVVVIMANIVGGTVCIEHVVKTLSVTDTKGRS
jgi:hypothetical protein